MYKLGLNEGDFHLNNQQVTLNGTYKMMMIPAMIFFLFILLIWRKVRVDSATGEAPEPKGAWPIIGHLPLLFGKAPAHRILGGIADRHGPLFKLRMGALKLLVVSSAELSKECFTTSDRALQSRPLSPAGRILCFNYASFGLSPASPTWRLTRKITVHDLLSTSRLNSLHHLWASEVDLFVEELRGLCIPHGPNASEASPTIVDFKEMLWGFCSNVTTRLVVGKRFFVRGGVDSKEGLRFKQLAKELIRLVGVPIVADSFPLLKFLDWKYEWDLKKAFAEVESVMQGWLDEHERSGSSDKTNLMEVLISLGKEGQLDNPDHSVNHIIKATAFMMIIASSEPTFLQLIWVFSLLVNNPRVFTKARAELDSLVGEDRVVDRSDIPQLKYLQAIVKETLRLYPVAPFLVPHEAIEDCKIGTAHVPAGTRVVVNAWKMQRDPKIWSNPDEFRPERFLEEQAHVNPLGRHFELLPFGSGRRSCVGTVFALEVMHLLVARVVHEFDLSTLLGAPVDITEHFGLTLQKLTPFDLEVMPRLSPAKRLVIST